MSDTPNPNQPFALDAQFAANPAATQPQAVMAAALASSVPRLYANGLVIAINPTDVIVTFFWNGVPAGNVNFSLPLAKGFADDLAKAVNEYERTSEQSIQTAGQIGVNMQRHQSEPATPSR